jgi:hypothetical protein
MKLVVLVVLALAGAALLPASASAVPTIIPTCDPAPQSCGGWYREPVTITWDWLPSSATPVAGCATRTINFDTREQVEFCRVTDGQTATVEVPLRVDMTAPLLTGASTSRPPDANGWFRTPVQVGFAGNDETSGIQGCTGTMYTGPDATAASVEGVCRDRAGNTSQPSTFHLNYDATAPAINGITPARPPDHDTWYTAPVGFAVAAADGLSGLAGCDPLAYGGPASAAAVVQPTCRDLAGNVGTRSFTFPFDASPPALGKVKVRPGDRVVRLNWAAADAAKVRIVRSPGRGGAARTEIHDGGGTALVDTHVRNGRRYRYRFAAVDQAGNESARTVRVVPGPRLVSPRDGARLDKPPTLRWTAVRGADYYNVQLWRGDRKLLSVWPTGAKLKLKRAWRYSGRQRLQRGGRYRWLVWPGEGPRAQNDYGRLIGRRTFIFAPGS